MPDTAAANELRDENPLLAEHGLPPFDRITPAHIEPAISQLLSRARTRLDELEQDLTPTWSALMDPLDEIDREFEYAWSPVSHLFGVKNSPELREAYEAVLPAVVEFGLRVSQSEPLYNAMKQMRDGEEWERLDEAQRRILSQKLLNAELSGIALPPEQRSRFNEIANELSQLSTTFSNHVLDATKAFSLLISDPAQTEGLPASLRRLTSQSYNVDRPEGTTASTPDAGPWKITLDLPVFGPFMEHCRDRGLREQVYRAFVTKASDGEMDNTPLITRILTLRKEQAELLGYKSFAEVSLAKKMAGTVQAVEEMFAQLREPSWEPAVRDQADLEEIAAQNGQTEPLEAWDLAYWAERLREQQFAFTDEELRPYFALPKVLDGLFSLLNRLFGITISAADEKAPRWHSDVRYFEVFDDDGTPIAGFYLDPYSRPADKRGGAWMDVCLTRRRTADDLQLPVAHLVCNSTPPVNDTPSLMTFREVETLFHEFGHGLQHMLTTVDYADAAGIGGVEWDAVELPSQFMEYWCYHKPTLMGLALHHETGEPLPDELFEKITAARNYRAGTMMLRQLRFGMTDMRLHTTFDPTGPQSAHDVQKEIAASTSVMPPLPEDRSLCGFQHIFAGGYSAGYYSYKWAEILSADAFSAFEDAGLDDAEAVAATGRRFRDTVLALGGSRHPMEVFESFRGRRPSPEPLLRHCGLLT